MLPRRAFDYLFIGFVHIELQTIQAGKPLRANAQGPLDRLDWYLENLVALGLATTVTAAWELQTIRDRLRSLPPEFLLSEGDAQGIRNAALMLRETLKAETTNLTLFEPTGKRFDTKALLQNVPSLMRKGTYEELPVIAAIDLHEAAVCVAFERPTAAAFHSVRATEAVLRQYYGSVVVRKRLSKPWLWKPMLVELEKPRRARVPSKAVLDHLDSIRENFRNPTQHPEKVYDIDEAQSLFGQCLSVIEGMVADAPWQTPADAVRHLVPPPS